MITITYEEFKALEVLSRFSDYYIDDMEQSDAMYESDKEDIRESQEILSNIYRRF